MNKNNQKGTLKPIGYTALLQLFGIKAIPHYCQSYLLTQGSLQKDKEGGIEICYYPPKYFTKEYHNPLMQMEFALKYEGVNLSILAEVCKKIDATLLVSYIRAAPTSKWARRIWYLYELLTEIHLDIQDAVGGSYAVLVDPTKYYTAAPVRSCRHYIDDNLLGNRMFCPMVRRTPLLDLFVEKNFSIIVDALIAQYEPQIIHRAIQYLYAKETRSSYAIERESPSVMRAQKFVELLQQSHHLGILTKEALIQIQNKIVDPRYSNQDYRNFQNYISTEARLDVVTPVIAYIAPKPQDVSELMTGLLMSLERMIACDIHPVIIAATISFGFVFIHPFEDGNGRLHRFLIHYIFTRTEFVPKETIFPISAVILQDIFSYDSLLESVSKPLLALLTNYQFDMRGELTVHESTARHYKYIDYTQFVAYLFACVEKTIVTDFHQEMQYILRYDTAKKALQNVVDMPDQSLHLFIRCLLQNQGRLSSKKQKEYFSHLTSEEVSQMEKIVQQTFVIQKE